MENNLTIRSVSLNDTEELINIYSYYVLNTSITFEYEVPTFDEFSQRIQKITQKYPYLVAIVNHEIVGYCYATTYKDRPAYDWTVETSVYIKQDYHHLGIGTKLYNLLEEALKEKDIKNMLACITIPNNESIDFHTKQGFVKVGHFSQIGYKLGEWRDTVWMQKVIK